MPYLPPFLWQFPTLVSPPFSSSPHDCRENWGLLHGAVSFWLCSPHKMPSVNYRIPEKEKRQRGGYVSVSVNSVVRGK